MPIAAVGITLYWLVKWHDALRFGIALADGDGVVVVTIVDTVQQVERYIDTIDSAVDSDIGYNGSDVQRHTEQRGVITVTLWYKGAAELVELLQQYGTGDQK